MTAGPSEDATAAATQAKGEAAAAAHEADTQAQHQASGSTVVVEQASTPDDVAVQWSPADTTASPSLVPSQPPPVNRSNATHPTRRRGRGPVRHATLPTSEHPALFGYLHG